MTVSTTVARAASAQRTQTTRPRKTPRLPTTGTNEALDAAIAGAQAMLDGYLAVCDGTGTKKGQARFDAYLARFHKATEAVLDVVVASLAEAQTKLHAYVMAEALVYGDGDRWRAIPADQAIRILDENDGGNELPFVLRTFRADVERLAANPPVPPAPSPPAGPISPELQALDAELRGHLPIYKAAEDAADTLVEIPEKEAALVAAMNAQQAINARLRAYTPRGFAELALKADLMALDRWDEQAEVKTLTADIQRLTAAPPSGGGAHPDADILALAEEFEAAWAATRAYPIANGDEGYEVLCAATDAIGDRIMRIRATTLDGLRVKARVVQECQTDDPSEPVELSTDTYCDTRAAEAIVNDLLGVPERTREERATEDDAERAAYEALTRPRRGMRERAELPAEVKVSIHWHAAVARYVIARADYAAVVAESHAAHAREFAECPAALKEENAHYGVHLRWTSEHALDGDVLLTPEEREEIRPILQAWLVQWNAMSEADQFGDEFERLDDVACDAEQALMQTPTPSLEALVYKLALEAREADDDKYGYDDLGRVAYLRTSTYDNRAAVQTFTDALRLAGMDHPMLHLEPFSPRGWITAFEALGGYVCHRFGEMLLVQPRYASSGERAEMWRLIDELDAAPWKYRAVAYVADDRRDDGGDPLYDGSGQHGREDNRGAPPKGPSLPFWLVDRVRFGQRDGLPYAIVERLERQDGRLRPIPEAAALIGREALRDAWIAARDRRAAEDAAEEQEISRKLAHLAAAMDKDPELAARVRARAAGFKAA